MRGDMFLKELEADSLADEKILKLAERVHVHPVESLRTDTAIGRTILTIECSDGAKFNREIEAPLGSPERPMSLEACAAKLMKCSEYAVRQPKEESLKNLINQAAHMEEIDDVSQLMVALS